MITEQFLNSCFYLLLNESMGVKKDKTLYRDIYEVIQFYKDKETLELSTLMKPKFDCLDRICELGLESREISNILDSILGGDKFKNLNEFITMVLTDEIKSNRTADYVKQLRVRKRVISLFSNYDQISKFVETIESGNIDDLDKLTCDYEGVVKGLYTNLMEESRSVNVESISALDIMSDDFTPVIEQIKRRNERLESVPTGYDYIDDEVLKGGLEPTRLYMIGGASGAGKSTLLNNLIVNASKKLEAKEEPNILLYITLENLIDESFERAYCCYFDVKSRDFVNNLKTEDDKINMKNRFKSNLMKNNSNILMYYHKPRSISPVDIMMIIDDVENIYGKGTVRCVYIDYIDLLMSDLNYENDYKELDAITLGLKLIAVEYNIPVVTVTQLTRSSLSVADPKELSLDMFARSVGKYEHSDVCILIAKDKFEENIIHMRIAKNRSGKAGQTLSFDADLSKFKIIQQSSMISIPVRATFDDREEVEISCKYAI